MDSSAASARLLRLMVGWAAVGGGGDEGDGVSLEGCCRLMPPNVGIGLDSKDDVDAGLDGWCAFGANKGAMRTGGEDALAFDDDFALLLASAFLSSLLVISSFGKSSSISMWALDCFSSEPSEGSGQFASMCAFILRATTH